MWPKEPMAFYLHTVLSLRTARGSCTACKKVEEVYGREQLCEDCMVVAKKL